MGRSFHCPVGRPLGPGLTRESADEVDELRARLSGLSRHQLARTGPAFPGSVGSGQTRHLTGPPNAKWLVTLPCHCQMSAAGPAHMAAGLLQSGRRRALPDAALSARSPPAGRDGLFDDTLAPQLHPLLTRP